MSKLPASQHDRTTGCALMAMAMVALLLCPTAAVEADEPDPFGPAAVGDAIEQGTLDELRIQAEKALQDHLATTPRQPEQAEQLIRLAAVRQFAGHFGRADSGAASLTESQQATLRWLADQPQLFDTLALAMEPENEPDAVLDVIARLREAEREQLEQFAELTIAFAVVWDNPPDLPHEPEDPLNHAVELFQYYLRNHEGMRYDLRRMPWELSIYLAAGQASVQEYRWVRSQRRYDGRQTQAMGEVYFDVPYDQAGLYTGEWQGPDGQPYTLANLRSAGGVCKDQAYFAAHVNRAFGIPAVICAGRSGRGVGYHAWIGYLKPDRDGAAWDFNTARYAEHQYWSASVDDPQTGREMSDGDVSARGRLFGLPLRQRLMSTAIVRVKDLLEPDRRAELLKLAVDTSPGNLAAWWALADHYGGEGADVREVTEMLRVVREFTLNRYDEFGFELFIRTIRGLPTQVQFQLVASNHDMFRRRPDLASRLQIVQAALMAEQGNERGALSLWTQVARRNVQTPPVLLEATDRIDDLLREQEQVDRLVVIYRTIWEQMNPPDPSGYAWTTPWFLVGQRYAQALEDAGDRATARRIRDRLDERDTREGEQAEVDRVDG